MISSGTLTRCSLTPKFSTGCLAEGHQRILVGVKSIQHGGDIITWALTEAARSGDALTVMHVTEPCAAAAISADAARKWDARKEEILESLSALVLSRRAPSKVPQEIAVTVAVVVSDNVSKAIVNEARHIRATKVILGKSQVPLSLSPKRMNEVGRLCVKNLSPYCQIITVRKGKMLVCRPGTAKAADRRMSLGLLFQTERESLGKLLQLARDSDRFSREALHEEKSTLNASTAYDHIRHIPANEEISDSPGVCSTSSTTTTRDLMRTAHSRDNSISEKSFDRISSTASGYSTTSNGSPISVLDRSSNYSSRMSLNHALDLPHLNQFLVDAVLMGGDRSSSSLCFSGSQEDTSPPSSSSDESDGPHLSSGESKRSLEAVSEEGAAEGGGDKAGAIVVRFSPPRLARTCSELKYELTDDGLRALQRDLEEEIPSIRRFSYLELEEASNHFSNENLIGVGGTSSVYKAQLPDGNWVAVKRLTDNASAAEKEFMMEIMMLICTLHHPNLVTLVGFCAEGPQRLLVYEFLVHGNLEQKLHDESPLNWAQRQKAAIGAARGLAYLHNFEPRPIIHHDVKTQNILLREDFEAQISDFGLAKWCSKGGNTDPSIHSVAGTFGYLAPECFMCGNFDEKTDVFSFGVVLLELISGRKPIDRRFPDSQQSLVQWARTLHRKRELHKLVDPRLTDINPEQFKRMMYTAFLCIKMSPDIRPTMDRVVKLLDPLCEYSEEPLLFSPPSIPSPLPALLPLPVQTPIPE